MNKENNILSKRIEQSSFILTSYITNHAKTDPLVVIFYTYETGYDEYLNVFPWAKKESISLILVNIKANWDPKQRYTSWKNYNATKMEIANCISELIQLNITNNIYFQSNWRTNTIILDLLYKNYPLRKYLKGFLNEEIKFINYKELSPIRLALRNLSMNNYKRIFSPIFLRSIFIWFV